MRFPDADAFVATQLGNVRHQFRHVSAVALHTLEDDVERRTSRFLRVPWVARSFTGKFYLHFLDMVQCLQRFRHVGSRCVPCDAAGNVSSKSQRKAATVGVAVQLLFLFFIGSSVAVSDAQDLDFVDVSSARAHDLRRHLDICLNGYLLHFVTDLFLEPLHTVRHGRETVVVEWCMPFYKRGVATGAGHRDS